MTGAAAVKESAGLLQEVQFGTEGNTISLHRINEELLADMMGAHRGDPAEEQSLAVMQKAQVRAERLHRLALGVPVDTMDELHATAAARPLLAAEKPLALKRQQEVGPSTSKVPTALDEQDKHNTKPIGPAGSAL
jgi:hypothetical protein